MNNSPAVHSCICGSVSEITTELKNPLCGPNDVCLCHFSSAQMYIFTTTCTRSADFRDEEGSDDNRSSSLGRSAPSDDASVASDYQDDGAPECELTIIPRLILFLRMCVCV